MPLQLYASNSLERLSQKLTEDLRQQTGSVFLQPCLVTQTDGINSWLKVQIAQQLGIAANLRFLSPTDIVAAVYSVVCRRSMPSAGANQLQWILYDLLGETEFISQFPNVSAYYTEQEAKKLSLAMKVADLFDQYQVYRPKEVEEWNIGKAVGDNDLQWQAFLWQRLQLHYGNSFTDRTKITRQILDALQHEENRNRLKETMPQIYFFGLAIITPYYLELFRQISEIVTVNFYLNNPAPDTYWMDQVTEKAMVKILHRDKRRTPEHFHLGNDLLLNWGKVIKDSFWLLFNNDSFLNVYDDSYSDPPQHNNTILKKIQTDIYNNARGEDRQELYWKEIESDESITIQTAYTPAREVEVLYNHLVHLIDKREEKLAPRDILVMVNDIDRYAPFIRAVFDNAPYRFPYHIADESVEQGNTIFSAIHQILDITEDSFTSETIAELLDNKYIRSRFDITQPELIRKALKEANIRFGWRGDSANDTRYFSWEYGLKRLLLGVCISGSPLLEEYGEAIEPVDAFEGDASLEIVRFIHFVRSLRKYIYRNEEHKTLAEWMTYLKTMVEEMIFEAVEQEDDDYHLFIKYTERLEGDASLASIPVSFEAFRKGFVDRMSTEKRKHSFIRGGVTFCSFIPMRSVPFKVVAMLGLDYDKFPRKEKQISFSLFQKKQEKGDRNVKENDKHLFLETLLSARDYLYLSYIGRDMKDGAELPPSMMVEELIDYVVKGVHDDPIAVRKKWVKEHPLHGFSKHYFTGEGLYSYLGDNKLNTPVDIYASSPDKKNMIYHELEIDQLIRFFEHPVRWYFNKVLQVYYRKREDLLLPEEELFELNKWDSMRLQKTMLDMDREEVMAQTETWIRNGQLPLKNMGIVAALNTFDNAILIRNKIMEITGGVSANAIPFSLNIEDILITGKLDSVYDKNILAIAMEGEKPRVVWIGAYLKYLIAQALGQPLQLNMLYFDSKKKIYKTAKLSSDLYPASSAMEKLTRCIQLFREGQEQPLEFCPTASDPEKIFMDGQEAFIQHLQKMRDSDEYSDLLNDLYYVKADENGYFDSTRYTSFENNTGIFFNDLKL